MLNKIMRHTNTNCMLECLEYRSGLQGAGRVG